MRQALRLWSRQFKADPWVIVTLALLVFAASVLVAAVPRALSMAADRQLEEAVTALSAYQREPVASYTTIAPYLPDASHATNLWPAMIAGAERVRQEQPPLLREMLLPAQFIARTDQQWVLPTPEGNRFYQTNLLPVISPQLTETMDLVSGEWPTATYELPHPIALDEEVARQLEYELGDVLGEVFQIVGLVSSKDPDDPRWEYYDLGNAIGVENDPNLGEAANVWGYLAPEHNGALSEQRATQVRYQMWYPLSVTQIASGTDAAQLQAELTRVLAGSYSLVTSEEAAPEPGIDVSFESLLGTTLERVLDQQRATAALVAVVAAGPIGVAAAVLILGAQLAVLRRRRALGLAIARGASPEQLRTLIGIEVAVFSVPAAAAGQILAASLIRGHTQWWQWLVTALLAAAAPAALVAAVRGPEERTRKDLSLTGGQWRWAAEIAVVAVAAAATWQLLRRDDSHTASLDLLAAATPVLLALSAGIIVIRLYPLPLAALTRMLHRGKSLTPYLGSARALRDPAGGLVPTLAVVLGTTVAVLSTVLLSTVTRGTEVAMWTDNGGSVRVSGPRLSDEMMQQLRELDDVAAAGRLSEAGSNRELQIGGEITSVRVWIADDELREVWAEPTIAGPPDRLFDTTSPTVVTGGDAPALTGPMTLSLMGPATAVGHLEALPGSPVTRGDWIVVTRSTWTAAGGPIPPPTLALIRTEDGAQAEAIEEQILEIVGPAMITHVDAELERHLDGIVVRVLTTAFIAAAILTSLLTVMALVVVQAMGAPSRSELLAVLRTLGASPRQARGMVTWELAPLVVAAILVGAGLGISIGWLMVHTLDLTSITGGSIGLRLYLDPVSLALVLAAVVVTMSLAIVVSAWLAGRTNLAQALRIGEQR